MLRTRLMPIAIALGFVLADFSSAMALPVAPDAATKAAASLSKVQLARFVRYGGGFHGGFARGYGGRGYAAHRGYGLHGRYAGRYGYGRYGWGRGYGWGAAAAATGVGVAAATSPYWYGGYGYNNGYNSCGPYQYYYPGYGCVNR
jgi:hypothetical protein